MKSARNIVCVFLACLILLGIMAVTAFAATTSDNIISVTDAIPMVMQPGTVLIYDENLIPIVQQGGYVSSGFSMNTLEQRVCTFTTPVLVDTPEDASFEIANQIQLENLMAQEQYEDLVSGNYIREETITIYPMMKVVYDEESGHISNIYYPDTTEPSGYSINNVPDIDRTAQSTMSRTITSGDVTWTWGTNYTNTLTYRVNSDSFLGTGRATYFTDTYGNRNNILSEYDCATKMAYDYSRVGDEDVQIRNLITDEVFTYYQADVGSLPDAIIDIWGLDNIHELAGSNTATSAVSVRYYHKRFSDQSIPTS